VFRVGHKAYFTARFRLSNVWSTTVVSKASKTFLHEQ
jgi:hypothetical protein